MSKPERNVAFDQGRRAVLSTDAWGRIRAVGGCPLYFLAHIAAVWLLCSVTSAATPGWEIEFLDVTGTIDSHTKAEDLLRGNWQTYGTLQRQRQAILPVIDLGAGGNYPWDLSFTGQDPQPALDDFAVRARANVVIPSGTWTLALGSDDGGQLTLGSEAVAFGARFGGLGAAHAQQVRYEGNRLHGWTGGTFTVAAPVAMNLTASMHDRGGGESFEIAVARGAYPDFDPAAFQLLSDGTLGWSVTTNSTAPRDSIYVGGRGNLGRGGARIDGLETRWAPANGPAQPGLTQRWYAGTVTNLADALQLVLDEEPVVPAFVPAHAFSSWWSGSGSLQPAITGRYPSEISSSVSAALNVEAASPLDLGNYTAVLTGQIRLEENGVYRFKDGVADYASLRIDLNQNGVLEAHEQLVNDATWTNLAGDAQGGSPVVTAQVTGLPAGGGWVDFELIASHRMGRDQVGLMWDYDPAKPGGSGLGQGAALGFPVAAAETPGQAVGISPAQALDQLLIPDTHLRTRGVPTIEHGRILASLLPGASYALDIHSRSFHDQLGVDHPLAEDFEVTLDLNNAHVQIQGIGDLCESSPIMLVNADDIVGDASGLEVPAGTSWDISSFEQTGEIRLMMSCHPINGSSVYDADKDGDVDSADLLGFIAAWTGSNAGNLEDAPGRANLVYNPATGEVKLVPAAGSKIVGFTLGNSAGQLKPGANDEFTGKTPWADVVYDNKATQIGSSDLSFVGATSEFSLGNILPEGLSKEGVQGFLSLARYSAGLGTPQTEFDLVVVPEPASMALLGLGLLGVVNSVRRRRS